MTTRIIPPRVALTDPRTGMVAREWYLYFLSLNSDVETIDGNALGFAPAPIPVDAMAEALAVVDALGLQLDPPTLPAAPPSPTITVQDEGTPLTTAVTLFNFAGAGVTVTEPTPDQVLVTIPGGGGGGGGFDLYTPERELIIPVAVSATPSAIGMTVSGSTSFRALNDTDIFTRRKRYAISTAALANVSQFSSNTSATISLRRGFTLRARFGNEAINSDGRLAVGAIGTWAGGNDPVNAVSSIFVGKDSADTNLSIFHNDAAGTCTKVALGASFPANTNVTDIYEATFTAVANGTSVDYSVTNIITAATTSGTISTELPAVGTFMTGTFRIATGTTATACAMCIFGYSMATAAP